MNRKKDSHKHSKHNVQKLPVDHYRKKIGREHKKQSQEVQTIARKQTENKIKKESMYQDVRYSVMAVGIVSLVAYAAIYYFWLMQ